MLGRPNTALSQIHMQIMWSRLIAVVEEQAQTLVRTAFSTTVREAGDLSAGVFDRDGNMLAQAVTGTPGHVNSMAESVKHFISHFPLETMKEGVRKGYHGYVFFEGDPDYEPMRALPVFQQWLAELNTEALRRYGVSSLVSSS